MQIPETPNSISELDLMKRLAAYGSNTASYLLNGKPLGESARKECAYQHSMLIRLEKTVAPLLDKVTAKEMDTFTAHDRKHSLKVAHIIWHIIEPERRQTLTPPEIGLLVASAFMHDLGMFLSNSERAARFDPASDLWDRLELNKDIRSSMNELQKAYDDEKTAANKQRLLRRLMQAQEALLCLDNRERHASKKRYEEIIQELRKIHEKDRINICDIDAALCFEGDPYLAKLIDICVSHGEPAEALVNRDPVSPEKPRFPRNYPVGSVTADLHFVAAALRMADILDFDRERTPAVLYHYFLPNAIDSEQDRSELEWSKHLSISNWHLEDGEILFRGRCRNYIVHHGILSFCKDIGNEIALTLETFLPSTPSEAGFSLSHTVNADIHSEGYTYVPYTFELDDERIHQLLMGGAIYPNALYAIRELIQNAVDACCLRDALTRLSDVGMNPSTSNRIFITYFEPSGDSKYPILEVRDTGTGMDEWIINRWFLKVGCSYYNSHEFNRFRLDLRKQQIDFAPVSEFGIGFLSVFLLADKVEVETAMWEPVRGDTKKRRLEIHGPTRLIKVQTEDNVGVGRFRGTSVKLHLNKEIGKGSKCPYLWNTIRSYIENVCISLPYEIVLKRTAETSEDISVLRPKPIKIILPHLLKDKAEVIEVNDEASGLSGQIALVMPSLAAEIDSKLAKDSVVRVLESEDDLYNPWDDYKGSLIRGGFRVGSVPGLPSSFRSPLVCQAVLRMDWKNSSGRKYALTNLSRTGLKNIKETRSHVFRIWMSHLIKKQNELPLGFTEDYSIPRRFDVFLNWMESHDAFSIYKLAANGWHSELLRLKLTSEDVSNWENSKGKAFRSTILTGTLHSFLQDIVLPKVCKLKMSDQGRYYISPPTENWITTLKEWRSFISSPVTWGHFAEYIDPIADLVYYEYPEVDHLNSKHRDRIESCFSPEELPELIEVFRLLAHSKQEKQVDISSRGLSLLKRAKQSVGDLEIGELSGKWRIDSYKC